VADVLPVLDPVRFGPERVLIEQLSARFGLDVLIEHFVSSGGVRTAYDAVLGSQLRLTKLLAPRLMSLLDEVRERLGFHERLELFVGQGAMVNAGAMHAISEHEPHVIELTSALVERMNDDELRFVLGHELGHLAYRHYRARLAVTAFGVDELQQTKAPALLVRRLETWDRLAEISADRAGFMVIDHRLDVAVSAFFKLQAGLGPEHLRFDLAAFLDQLALLEKLERRELLAEFSHPATPIRVRALQLFANAVKAGQPLTSIDSEVSRIARLMDYAPSEPLDVHARDFLLAGGLLATEADLEGMDSDEWEALVELLLPVSADPETDVSRITSRRDAERMLNRSAEYLQRNAGPERYELLRAQIGRAHV
jgi:Zn-dependent protease with chaperone function